MKEPLKGSLAQREAAFKRLLNDYWELPLKDHGTGYGLRLYKTVVQLGQQIHKLKSVQVPI